MFEILDRQGNVVDTATNFVQANDVVTFYTSKKRDMAPYNHRVAKAV